MFLTKVQRSPFYQIVYEVDGKGKSISTKTSLLPAAQKFLATFQPQLKQKNSTANNFITIQGRISFHDEAIAFTKLLSSFNRTSI